MKSSAYTLIEILIVISIVALVLGFGFAGFREYSQRQVLFAVARSVKSDLRSLQQKALAGEKTFCQSAEILGGYQFEALSTEYKMFVLCSGTLREISIKSLADSGFTITATVNPILFKVLGQGTNIPSGTSSVITLAQTAISKSITISVSAEGSIQ